MYIDNLVKAVIQELGAMENDSVRNSLDEILYSGLGDSKRIVFRTNQAEVFKNLNQEGYAYPHAIFNDVFINFTSPIDYGFTMDEEWLDWFQRGKPDPVFGMRIRTAMSDKSRKNLGPSGDYDESIATPSTYIVNTFFRIRRNFPRLITNTIFIEPDGINVPFGSESTDGFSYQIAQLAMNIMHYLSCENVEIEYHEGREGKEVLKHIGQFTKEPFYTVKLKRGGNRIIPVATGTGTKHGHMYDVEGHFRHLRHECYNRHDDGTYKVVWIVDHQRGLNNEIYLPAVRDTTNIPLVKPSS